MKQICLVLAAAASLAFVFGCSSEIEKPAPAPDAAAAKAAPAAAAATDVPIAFAGTFDPYLFRDKDITDRVVMKKRPECGSCHVKASLTGKRLHFVVDRGNRVNQWTIEGKSDGKTMVFKQGKLRIVLEDDKLTGKFTGDMHANIQLAAEPAGKK